MGGKDAVLEFDIEIEKTLETMPTCNADSSVSLSFIQEQGVSLSTYYTKAMRIAHEILLNPEFKVDERGMSVFLTTEAAKSQQCAQTCYFDSLVDDIRFKCYVQVFRCFKEVYCGLLDICSGKNKVWLKNEFDIDFIEEQVYVCIFALLQ